MTPATSRRRTRVLGLVLLALPLLLSLAPRSYLPHDEGYYALQARWIVDTGDWLTPSAWGQPLYDRTIGVQWLLAASIRLFGFNPLAVHLPIWLCAAAAVALCWRLSRSWVVAAVLVLTPLWFSYAQMATQDMPLLALELLGLWGLWTRRPVAAGLWLGPAFLIKGFMVLLPALAMLPLLLLERRQLLRTPRWWAALALGWHGLQQRLAPGPGDALPRTQTEALDALARSAVLRLALGERLCELYLAIKHHERAERETLAEPRRDWDLRYLIESA